MTLNISDIKFAFDKDDILKGVSASLGDQEILGILGPNGSGKTTLLRCINRILTPYQGSVAIDEKDIIEMSHGDISRNIAYVPQNAKLEMCAPSVYEIVKMGRRPHITWQYGQADEEIIWDCMEEMSVKELASCSFDRLSSGQSQRVLLARALAQEAKVLLLDEPTSNLDVKYQLDVMNTVKNIVHTKGCSACAVIHDLNLAMRFCDNIVLMKDGYVVDSGPAADIITPENIKEVFGVESCVSEI